MSETEGLSLSLKQRKEARLYELEVEIRSYEETIHQTVKKMNEAIKRRDSLRDQVVIDA